MLLIAECLGGKREWIEPCSYFCELIHNGTLVVDDIEDNSELRRGQPCLHKKYGIDVAINAGNGLFHSQEKIIEIFSFVLIVCKCDRIFSFVFCFCFI